MISPDFSDPSANLFTSIVETYITTSMITMQSAPSTMASPPPAPPPHKHSCVLCARRKIKCDKQDPRCSNCAKSQAECIYQAPAPPQRRKRQADEELISRLNHYEELLRTHKIDFKPSSNVLTPRSTQDTPLKESPSSPHFPQSAPLESIPPSYEKSGDG